MCFVSGLCFLFRKRLRRDDWLRGFEKREINISLLGSALYPVIGSVRGI